MKLQNLASSHVERGPQQPHPYSPAWKDGEGRERRMGEGRGKETWPGGREKRNRGREREKRDRGRVHVTSELGSSLSHAFKSGVYV